MRNVASFFLILCILTGSLINANQVVTGNATEAGKTFNFPIGSSVYNPATGTLFFSAQSSAGGAGIVNNFAVSRLRVGSLMVEGITPPTAIINMTESGPSPLFDAGIRDLALMYNDLQELPVVTTQAQPATVYMFDRIDINQSSILNFGVINDANIDSPQPVSSVHSLATDNQGHVVTAVTPSSGTFGDPGSGIALLIRGFVKHDNKDNLAARQIDAITGSLDQKPARSLPFDRTSSFLTFNDIPLAALQDNVVFHWDDILNVLYIGVQATSANNATAGVRGLAVAHIEQNKLIINQIAPESVFDDSNTSLIAARGANQAVSIVSIQTMHTSGGLVYLIILAGDPANPLLRVFPVINGTDITTQGVLAKKDAQPTLLFHQVISNVPTVAKRAITDPATTPDDLLSSTESAGAIGADGTLPGPIQSLFVESDVVYVNIAAATDNRLNGMYASRALLDSNGKIIGWTNWQKTAADNESVVESFVHVQNGAITTVVNDATNVANTVKRTELIDGSISKSTLSIPSSFINGLTTTNNITIENGIYIPATMPGLANTDILAIGMTDRIVLTQMATVVNNQPVATPTADFNLITSLSDGVVTTALNATILEIAGPVLRNIGPVGAFAIATDNSRNMAWLMVGGVGGLAIFADTNGNGWNVTTGLASHFTNIPLSSSFKQIGDFKFVRTIIADQNFVYVLTDSLLARINMAQSNIVQNQFNITIIATAEQLGVSGLSDMVISDAFALLGTTNGLFVIGAGKNITTVTSPADAAWHTIDLPEGASSIQQLIAVDQSGNRIDVSRNNGGIVYVLDANMSKDLGRVHRIAVQPIDASNVVTASQATIFNDLRVQNVPSHFLDFGAFRSLYYTDGSLYASASDASNGKRTFVRLIAPDEPTSWVPFLGLSGPFLMPTMTNFDTSMRAIIKLRAHGYFMILDNTHLYVNQ